MPLPTLFPAFNVSRRSLRAAVATVLALCTGTGHTQPAPEKVLNIYNWSEYIGENTVKAFEAETGITVHYDNFDSNEILLAKMIAGRTGTTSSFPAAISAAS